MEIQRTNQLSQQFCAQTYNRVDVSILKTHLSSSVGATVPKIVVCGIFKTCAKSFSPTNFDTVLCRKQKIYTILWQGLHILELEVMEGTEWHGGGVR